MLVLPIISQSDCPSWAMIELQGEIALRPDLTEDSCRVGTLALSNTVSTTMSFRQCADEKACISANKAAVFESGTELRR